MYNEINIYIEMNLFNWLQLLLKMSTYLSRVELWLVLSTINYYVLNGKENIELILRRIWSQGNITILGL